MTSLSIWPLILVNLSRFFSGVPYFRLPNHIISSDIGTATAIRRIDITYLPSDLCDWDWSFQPFVSLVMHSYRPYKNPRCVLDDDGHQEISDLSKMGRLQLKHANLDSNSHKLSSGAIRIYLLAMFFIGSLHVWICVPFVSFELTDRYGLPLYNHSSIVARKTVEGDDG